MKFTEILYVIDNEGNERKIFSCQVKNISQILTKDRKTKIEEGFKIVRKLDGACFQIFVVDKVKRDQMDLCLLDVHEF